jgi:streptogramin lyase
VHQSPLVAEARARAAPILCLTLAGLALAGAAPISGRTIAPRSIDLGSTPLQLVAARGALWALTCDHGCSGEGKRSVGRLVEIDPRNARVIASSTKLARPGAIAVGTSGVYATDFWRGTVRRLDPRTLRLSATLHLKLPFFITTSRTRDDAFLPVAIAVTGGSVWIATARGALARTDPHLRHVLATLRLPGDAFQAITATPNAVWLSESLLGIYRISTKTNKVVARLPIGPAGSRLDPVQLIPTDTQLLAIGQWTNAGTLTNRNGLARVDSTRNRVTDVTPLPAGQLTSAYGAGSLWVGHVNTTTLTQIDPRSGKTLRRLHVRVGRILAFAGGALWTALGDGTLQQVPTR